jgi:hypothetical protein
MNDVQTIPLRMEAFTTDQCVENWPIIERLIGPAMDFSPDITLEDVRKAVFRELYHVVGVYRDNEMVGAVVYKIQQETTAFILAIGGLWIAHESGIAQFKDFLRYFGMTRMQGIARPSVARMWQRLGIRQVYTVMETQL